MNKFENLDKSECSLLYKGLTQLRTRDLTTEEIEIVNRLKMELIDNAHKTRIENADHNFSADEIQILYADLLIKAVTGEIEDEGNLKKKYPECVIKRFNDTMVAIIKKENGI